MYTPSTQQNQSGGNAHKSLFVAPPTIDDPHSKWLLGMIAISYLAKKKRNAYLLGGVPPLYPNRKLNDLEDTSSPGCHNTLCNFTSTYCRHTLRWHQLTAGFLTFWWATNLVKIDHNKNAWKKTLIRDIFKKSWSLILRHLNLHLGPGLFLDLHEERNEKRAFSGNFKFP